MSANYATPLVVQVMQAFKEALVRREDNQLARMAKAWLEIEMKYRDQMLLLAMELEDAKLKGLPITEQLVWDMKRFQEMHAQMAGEVARYVDKVAIPDIRSEQMIFGEQGILGAQRSIAAVAGEQYMGYLGTSFNKLPLEAVKNYIGLAGDGSPLKDLLAASYPDAVDGMLQNLVSGVARGISPKQVAMEMANGFGAGLDRMTLIARTEQLRVWRTTSVQQYRESNVVSAFKRLAAKNENTCMACLALDGQLIPLGQELTDHPRGRCTTIPVVNGAPMPQWESGKDWFDKQPDSVKESMMGKDALELYKQGKVPFSAFAQMEHNAVWGDNPRTTSLAQLLKMGDGKMDLPKVPGIMGDGLSPGEAFKAIANEPRFPVLLGEAKDPDFADLKIKGRDISKVTYNSDAGAFHSYKVYFKDGSKGILKLDEAGSSWGDFGITEGFARREVTAYQLADELGLSVIPKTSQLIINGKYYSLQEFIPNAFVGAEAFHEPAIQALVQMADPTEPGQLGLLDFILGNQDRHSGNWMLDINGHLWGIDNGLQVVNMYDDMRDAWWARGELAVYRFRGDLLKDVMDRVVKDTLSSKAMGHYLYKLSGGVRATLIDLRDSGRLRELLEQTIPAGVKAREKAEYLKLIGAAERRANYVIDNWDSLFWE